jgi:CheY-like chemotaxis protein
MDPMEPQRAVAEYVLEAPEQVPVQVQEQKETQQAGHDPKRRVLVVDDEPDILLTLQQAFEVLLPDCEVLAARSAEEGIAAARQHKLDTIVTDFRMPGRDGLEMVEQLRKEGVACKAIVVTAFALPEIEARARQVGVDQVLSKPFDIRQLVAAVRGEAGRSDVTRRRPHRPYPSEA